MWKHLKPRAKGRPLFPNKSPAFCHAFTSHPLLFSIEDILAESDSDLSEDEGKTGNAQKKAGKSQKGRAWLREGEEDDPLNFLDPKVSQRVLGNNFDWQAKKCIIFCGGIC